MSSYSLSVIDEESGEELGDELTLSLLVDSRPSTPQVRALLKRRSRVAIRVKNIWATDVLGPKKSSTFGEYTIWPLCYHLGCCICPQASLRFY